jgi:small subunit ribosomal protein S8
MTDPISDLLTRMRNALQIDRDIVRIPFSKLKVHLLDVLKKEGFIKNHEVVADGNKKDILVHLKYADNGSSVINTLKRISKPGCRDYRHADEIKPVLNGLGIYVITTNKGVLSDRECREQKVGGEVLCEVW